MRFHWFNREGTFDLKKVSDKLEDTGFESVLLPYVAGISDHFTKIARYINPEQKLKYMVAIRPYLISPQYLAAINQTIQSFSEGRLAINFVSGAVDDLEKPYGGVIGDITDQTDHQIRKSYLCEYVKVFSELNFISKRPIIYLSGMSQEIFDTTEKYADANIMAYSYYRDNNVKSISKPRIISIHLIIRDTQEELDLVDKSLQQDSLFITKQDMIKLIDDLRADGIYDIMFNSNHDDEEAQRIFDFVKEYNSNN